MTPDQIGQEFALSLNLIREVLNRYKFSDYKVRLTPEYAVLGALYVGNTGAAGSGQLLLGDMLANHYLLLAGNLRSNLDESEFLLQYFNVGHRWQWGMAGYQFRDDLGVLQSLPVDLRVREDAEQIVLERPGAAVVQHGVDFPRLQGRGVSVVRDADDLALTPPAGGA